MRRLLILSDDFKTATLLAGVFGLLSALTALVLTPLLPVDSGALPLPLPLFSLILAFQLWLVYGLLAWAGFRLARSRGHEPAPFLSSLWKKLSPPHPWSSLGAALVIGAACGVFVIRAVSIIRRLAPESLPATLHPPTLLGALLSSMAASVGEEILCRLFLLSLLRRILPVSRFSTFLAISLSALIFGVLHTPGLIFLYSGFQNVPLASWVWVIGLNALVGSVYGILFMNFGIESAIAGHLGTDLVWHVLSQWL